MKHAGQRTSEVLEIGCGPVGRRYVARPGEHVTHTDREPRVHPDRIFDAFRLPWDLADASLDTVVWQHPVADAVISLLYNEQFFHELRRVLCAGGRMEMLVTWLRPGHLIDVPDWQRLLEQRVRQEVLPCLTAPGLDVDLVCDHLQQADHWRAARATYPTTLPCPGIGLTLTWRKQQEAQRLLMRDILPELSGSQLASLGHKRSEHGR